MIQALGVKPREGLRIWLRFSDGSAGEVDLSDLAGRGVFRAWSRGGVFEKVHVAPHGAIAWNDEIELCADSLYLELTGKSAEECSRGCGPAADVPEFSRFWGIICHGEFRRPRWRSGMSSSWRRTVRPMLERCSRGWGCSFPDSMPRG
ncbi:MAG: DUF2442 domain-containing protein [Gemmatimonadota bacterium]|nr:DUF2442 domain-containing protein [Gemmatimonadota bacterium]